MSTTGAGGGSALELLREWRIGRENQPEDALVFATRSGKPIAPKNVMHRWIVSAATALPPICWLTFRRTYVSWAHEKGVPAKVAASLMGHAKVDTTLNEYTQVIDGAQRSAASVIGAELFTIVQKPEAGAKLTH